MPTSFDTSFGADDLIEAGHVSQYAGPLNSLESGEAFYAADAGSTDAYAITMTPGPTAYTAGMLVHFKANTANTGAASLNVNGLGAKTLKKNVSSDLATNDILAGQIVTAIYDGTNFQAVNVGALPATALDSLSDVVAPSPAAGDVLVFDGSDWVPGQLPSLDGPDYPPAAPDPADDEFRGAALDTAGTRFSGATAWAWNNQSTSTAVVGQGHLHLSIPGASSIVLRGVEQVAPSTPWTYRAKLRPGVVTESNSFHLGLVVRNSSSGKLISFANVYGGGNLLMQANRWSSNTSFSANIFNTTGFSYQPLYLELECDGTTLTFRRSESGVDGTFKTMGSDTLSSFISSIDRIGVFCNSENSQVVSILVDWFRRVA